MDLFVAMCIGFLITLVLMCMRSPLIRVDFSKVSTFLAIMALVTCTRISLHSAMVTLDPSHYMNLPNLAYDFDVWKLLIVFWEDAFFAIPIYGLLKWSEKGTVRKEIAVVAIVVLSLYFASGHLYQSWISVIVLSFYPYFVSYKLGKKYGFGTVMVCHILYDFITFYTMRFMPYLV